MKNINPNKILKIEKDSNLSLFRISLTFFGGPIDRNNWKRKVTKLKQTVSIERRIEIKQENNDTSPSKTPADQNHSNPAPTLQNEAPTNNTASLNNGIDNTKLDKELFGDDDENDKLDKELFSDDDENDELDKELFGDDDEDDELDKELFGDDDEDDELDKELFGDDDEDDELDKELFGDDDEDDSDDRNDDDSEDENNSKNDEDSDSENDSKNGEDSEDENNSKNDEDSEDENNSKNDEDSDGKTDGKTDESNDDDQLTTNDSPDSTGDVADTPDATETASDAKDAAGDTANAAEAVGDTANAAETVGDAANAAEAVGDAANAAEAVGDAANAAEAVGDAANAAGAVGDAVGDAGDVAGAAGDAAGAAGDVAGAAGDAAGAAGNVAGEAAGALGAVNDAKDVGKALKNAPNNPSEAAGELATKGLKYGAQAAGDLIAPGVGTAAKTAIGVIEKTAVGKKAKACCGTATCGSCLITVICAFMIILMPVIVVISAVDKVLDTIGNIVEEIVNFITGGPSESEQHYEALLEVARTNYSVNKLKSSPNEDGKHITIFQDILDYDPNSENNRLTDIMGENPAHIFDIALIPAILDTEYDVYNPTTNQNETVSLRDLFEDISEDAPYASRTIRSMMRYEENEDLADAFSDLQELLVKIELATYERAADVASDSCFGLIFEYPNISSIYSQESFFEGLPIILDASTYVALSTSTFNPSMIYDIACESIEIFENGAFEESYITVDDTEIPYISKITTWYSVHDFEITDDGRNIVATNSGVRSEAEEMFARNGVHSIESFFSLFKDATGIDPVACESGTYGTTYSSSNEHALNISTFSPELGDSPGSFPFSDPNVRISIGFNIPYSRTTCETAGITYGTRHRGIDFAVSTGTDILAICGGTITRRVMDGNDYGCWIEVTHDDGTRARYGHGNQHFYVNLNDRVEAGDKLMQSGGAPGTPGAGTSTGPHLHLEVLEPQSIGSGLIDPSIYYTANPSD